MTAVRRERRGTAPFRYRGYTILWTGALVSNIGTWMETVALSYYVADTTGKASWAAIVGAAGFLPQAVLGPIGSALSDRLHRGRVLMATNALSALIAATLAILVGTGRATPAIIALLSLCTGSVGAFGFPAFQNALPRLVPREHLVAAVGLSNAQWNLGRIIGPSLAGVAIAIGGISAALWCNAISFLSVIVCVVAVRLEASGGQRQRVWGALMDGFRFARANAEMRRMVPLMIITMLVAAPFVAFVSQMATVVFHGDERATSLLVACQGIGAVVGAFTLGWETHRFGIWRVMAGSIAVLAAALVLYGAAPTLWIAAIGVAGCGFGYGTSFTTFAGLSQQAASDDMRGRVLAVNTFILGALYPIGALIQGWLSDRIGLKWVTAGSGVLLAIGLTWRMADIARRRRLDARSVDRGTERASAITT
jgi:predicted MFS family arabinose efflux permease